MKKATHHRELTCLPGLSPSLLSICLRSVLVLVGSSGACCIGPRGSFLPFFPNSFSTSASHEDWTWATRKVHSNLYNSRDKVIPSEILDSWNIVSNAWWVSAKEGRSAGFHLQPKDRNTKVSPKGNMRPVSILIQFNCNHFFNWSEEMLTGPHELIDFLWASFGSVHAVIFL